MSVSAEGLRNRFASAHNSEATAAAEAEPAQGSVIPGSGTPSTSDVASAAEKAPLVEEPAKGPSRQPPPFTADEIKLIEGEQVKVGLTKVRKPKRQSTATMVLLLAAAILGFTYPIALVLCLPFLPLVIFILEDFSA